jgi:hypothetical protein
MIIDKNFLGFGYGFGNKEFLGFGYGYVFGYKKFLGFGFWVQNHRIMLLIVSIDMFSMMYQSFNYSLIHFTFE